MTISIPYSFTSVTTATGAQLDADFAALAVIDSNIQKQTYTAVTTSGTSTAYTVVSSPAITSYAAGIRLNVTFHVASGASPTLQISSIAIPPNLVKQLNDGTYANISANDIPANHVSDVILLSASQALVVNLPPKPKSKLLFFSRSLAGASGNQSYTGVGFKPTSIIFYGDVPSTAIASFNGACDSSLNVSCISTTLASLSFTAQSSALFFQDGSANYQSSIVASLDSDGFTLTWTKSGTPTGTANCYALCLG